MAIKCIRNILGSHSEAKNALRELQIMRKFTYMKDNIYTTKLYDVLFNEENSLLYMVMEFIAHDLKEVLASKTQLNKA